jgi:hypothetical protein
MSCPPSRGPDRLAGSSAMVAPEHDNAQAFAGFITICPMQDRGTSGVTRRTVVRGAAWAVPVVVLGAPAQAVAASCTYAVTIVNTLLAGSLSGFDMLVRDTKFDAVPSTTALFTVGTKMPVLQLLVTCNGQPAAGVQVAVASDGQIDIEGIPLVKFVSPTIPTNVLEGTVVPSPYLGTTDAIGRVNVAVATATFQGPDAKPRDGVFTVVAGGTSTTFTYRLYDGIPLS